MTTAAASLAATGARTPARTGALLAIGFGAVIAILLLAGVVNLPVIYFSVQWWSTLHQGASISFTAAPAMARTMLIGILLMAGACWAYTVAVTLARVRCLIAEREALASRQ